MTVAESRCWLLREPKLGLALRDGILSIRVACSGFGPVCADDLRLTVPASVGRSVLEVNRRHSAPHDRSQERLG